MSERFCSEGDASKLYYGISFEQTHCLVLGERDLYFRPTIGFLGYALRKVKMVFGGGTTRCKRTSLRPCWDYFCSGVGGVSCVENLSLVSVDLNQNPIAMEESVCSSRKMGSGGISHCFGGTSRGLHHGMGKSSYSMVEGRRIGLSEQSSEMNLKTGTSLQRWRGFAWLFSIRSLY